MKRNYYFTTKGTLDFEQEVLRFNPINIKESRSVDYDEDDWEAVRSDKKDIPLEDIASISLFANVTINNGTYNVLSQKGIPVFFFDKNASPSGSYYPYSSTNDGEIMIFQSAHYISKSKRLFIAASFIKSAAHNILKNLEYYKNRSRSIDKQIAEINTLSIKLDSAKDVKSIMLIEAAIRKSYYSAFNSILLGNIKFTKREYNPPTDPVNAMLSFFNALLYSLIESEMHGTKLSPFISFIHEPGASRASLVWDISEIFKPILVERLVFSLLNHKIITEEHFDMVGAACYLNKEGKKKAIKNFDEKVNKAIFNRETKKHQSFRTIIKYECYKLINHIKGEKKYLPFKIWW